MRLFFLLIAVCTTCFSSVSIADDVMDRKIADNIMDRKCKCYYKALDLSECRELYEINSNYHMYGKNNKAIASRRAEEIKLRLLPLDKQVEMFLEKVEEERFMEIPINMLSVVIAQWREFNNLQKEIKVELVKDQLAADYGKKRIKLSASAQEYKKTKVPFIGNK